MTQHQTDAASVRPADYPLDDAERFLIETIRQIQMDYQRQIQPYLDQLARVRALRPSPPVMVDIGSLPPSILEQISRG